MLRLIASDLRRLPSTVLTRSLSGTDIPVPDDMPVSPPSEPEVPKIDRSRPLPPPAYARSRLGNKTWDADTEYQDTSIRQPEYVDIDEPPLSGEDARAMDHEFNLTHKDTKRPEFDFDDVYRTRWRPLRGDPDARSWIICHQEWLAWLCLWSFWPSALFHHQAQQQRASKSNHFFILPFLTIESSLWPMIVRL